MHADHHEFEPELPPGALDAIRHTPAGANAPRLERVERRLVEALRENGTLARTGGEASADLRLERAPRRERAASRRVVWSLGAAAAAVVFALGYAAGARGAAGNPVPNPAPSGATAASDGTPSGVPSDERMEAAAHAYLAALAATHVTDSATARIALESFRAAATHVVRLDPEPTVALALSVAFPTSIVVSPASVAAATNARRVLWF